jgi:hypothetical protein
MQYIRKANHSPTYKQLMITPYAKAIESQMVTFYNSLSEKDKRRYAAIEILKLPYGGKSYIRDLLNCSFPTIDKGLEEIKGNEITETARIRKSGGGRKPCIDNITGINDLFLNVLKRASKNRNLAALFC